MKQSKLNYIQKNFGSNQRVLEYVSTMKNGNVWGPGLIPSFLINSISPLVTSNGANINLTVSLDRVIEFKFISIRQQNSNKEVFSVQNVKSNSINLTGFSLPTGVYIIVLCDIINTIVTYPNALKVTSSITSFTPATSLSNTQLRLSVNLSSLTTVVSGTVTSLADPTAVVTLSGFPLSGYIVSPNAFSLATGNYVVNLVQDDNSNLSSSQVLKVNFQIVSISPMYAFNGTAFTLQAVLTQPNETISSASLKMTTSPFTAYSLSVLSVIGVLVTFNPVILLSNGSYNLVIINSVGESVTSTKSVVVTPMISYPAITLPNSTLTQTFVVPAWNNGAYSIYKSSLNIGGASVNLINYSVAFKITYVGTFNSFGDVFMVGISDDSTAATAMGMPPSTGIATFVAGSSSNYRGQISFFNSIYSLLSPVGTLGTDIYQFREFFDGDNIVLQSRVNTNAWTVNTSIFNANLFTGSNRYLTVLCANNNTNVTNTFKVDIVPNP